MATITQKPPNGWKKWLYVKTTIESTQGTAVENVQMPDASFPWAYTPSSSFWLRSEIDHCYIEWLNPYDTFSLFLLGGGAAGSVIGSLGGLSLVDSLFSLEFASASFSVFGTAPGPRFGYCIGNEFKQHVYVRFDIQNSPNKVLLMYKGIELLENGNFKRIYLKEGKVEETTLEENKCLVNIGMDKTNPPPFDAFGQSIQFTNSSGEVNTFTIVDVTDAWEIVISVDETNADKIPKAGEYYSLNKTWCLEDPYLLTGFWVGTEEEATIQDNRPTSGENLYVTQHNSPYVQSYFTGMYIWKMKEEYVGTQSVQGLPEIIQPAAGASMSDSGPYEWAFLDYENSADYSDTYKNGVRYKEERILRATDPNVNPADIAGEITPEPTGPNYIVQNVQRTVATESDLGMLINTHPSHVRVELALGGYSSRNNWHAPCLKGSYLVQGDKKFEIVGHVTADIIDVSYTSIDKKATIDLSGGQSYSILNQYAWMITEDYFEDMKNQRLGILEGTITDIGLDDQKRAESATIKTSVYPPIATQKKGGVSMIDRYMNEISIPSIMLKQYEKYYGWLLFKNNSSSECKITSLISSYPEGLDTNGEFNYDVYFDTSSSSKDFAKGDKVWITFDYPADIVGTWNRKYGYSINLEVAGGLSSPPPPYIVSDLLCMNGEYQSLPYKINITNEATIGVCDGIYFGLGANGSAQSPIGVMMLVTVRTSARGLASLFEELTQEGWVIHNDLISNKVTARIGSLNFKDYPKKKEIVIGENITEVFNPDLAGNEISFSKEYERVKKISISGITYEKGGIPAIVFNVGNGNYGFEISGDGVVDLQMLRFQGIGRGEIPSTTYKDDEDKPVSPVYVYKQSSEQQLNTVEVDMGVKTSEKVSVFEGEPQTEIPADLSGAEISVQYINDNQTLETNGFFDVIRMSDGEMIMIYGQATPTFRLYATEIVDTNDTGVGDAIICNGDDRTWYDTNAVFMISTINKGALWGTPNRRKDVVKHAVSESGGTSASISSLSESINEYSKTYQYPIMFLNSVDYLSCIYNEVTQCLHIFVKAFSKNDSYIGCFTMSTVFLAHTLFAAYDKNYNASSPSKSFLKFYYRPPLMNDDFVNDKDKSWINKNSDLMFGVAPPSETPWPPISDTYVRILGPNSTKSQVKSLGAETIIFTAKLPDGTYIMLYDQDTGICALYSNNQGKTWFSSPTVLVKNGRAGIIVGDYLFYIGDEGLMVKYTVINDFINNKLIAQGTEGNAAANVEILEQKRWDSMKEVLLISGTVDYQRLSGYVTPENYYRIFFYDENHRLKCVGSSNMAAWETLDNF